MSQTPEVSIPVGGQTGVGGLSIQPPTFLEVWGVTFVAVAGTAVLIISICLMVYFFKNVHPAPAQAAGQTANDYRSLLELHKAANDQFREGISSIFDLMVTRTIYPIVTLLLGYLFGSKKA